MKKYEKEKNVITFFNMLNEAKIEYILIKNIGEELPDKLEIGKDIDLLISEADRDKLNQFMKLCGRKIEHPYSRYNGWQNLYGLPEFEFWRLFRGKNLLVDITYQLCCMSLMPKTWLPLDKLIQKNAWENKRWNKELACWQLDNNTSFVYYLVRCIFDKKVFSEKYISELEKLEEKIDQEAVDEMLNLVFFKFTPLLKELLAKRKYNEIRQTYLAFEKY